MKPHDVIVDRRAFIFVSAAGATLLAAPSIATPPEPGDFRALMAALEQLGDELPAATGPAEQNAYIYRVAARAMLARDYPFPDMGPMGPTGIQIRPVARTDDISSSNSSLRP